MFKLRGHSLSLMSLLNERSNVISVRDQYTQDVLEYNGIHNTVIIGCPSNFINYNRNLGQSIKEKCGALLERDTRYLKHHICEYSQGHINSQEVLLNIARFLSNNISNYIIQSPDLLSFSLNETSTIPDHYQRAFRYRKSILKQKIVHFTNAIGWMEYSRGFDLSWGMRLHGNILPMQANVPALVITHDSRTEGLSDTMGLPNIGIDEFVRYRPKEYPKVILNAISEQIQQYDLKRYGLHCDLVKFIRDSGLEANDDFVGMFND
ncbi:hypothetical protein RN22_06385 [Grimontia sp. AD028]|nr:hypothetical protein RN22_06385 [Grimontia sp. AD028]